MLTEPGGSARRLHHLRDGDNAINERANGGGEQGSTEAERLSLLPGMVPPLSGQAQNANDNKVAEVRFAA